MHPLPQPAGQYAAYLKAVEQHVLQSPHLKVAERPAPAAPDEWDAENEPLSVDDEDGFAAVSWDDVEACAPAGGARTNLTQLSPDALSLMAADIAAHNVWVADIWEHVKV